MGINNIDDLKPSVKADEPTAPPSADNTTAGIPTPIDHVAQEESAETDSPEDSATGDGDHNG